MSILDVPVKRTRGNRKITKTWLKQHGFYQDRWGSPRSRQSEGSIFYEKLIYARLEGYTDDAPSILGSIMYFPGEFTGYATFSHMGFDRFNQSLIPNRTVVQFNNIMWEHNGWKHDAGFTTMTVNDMEEVMDILRIELSKHEFELVND